MLTRNEIKEIRSLGRKRERDEMGLFLAEGPKVVGDLLGKFPCRLLVYTDAFSEEFGSSLSSAYAEDARQVTQKELERASLLQSPQGVLALFEKPVAEKVDATLPSRELCIALDGVQDPGNVGTIVRIADWFGIRHVFCSPDTADVFAPKVVQATMGAIGRVKAHYLPLPQFLQEVGKRALVMGTFLDGANIYSTQLPATGVLLMGSEGHGISEACARMVSQRLLIPAAPHEADGSESLNVAVATSICVSELRRNLLRG